MTLRWIMTITHRKYLLWSIKCQCREEALALLVFRLFEQSRWSNKRHILHFYRNSVNLKHITWPSLMWPVLQGGNIPFFFHTWLHLIVFHFSISFSCLHSALNSRDNICVCLCQLNNHQLFIFTIFIYGIQSSCWLSCDVINLVHQI